ncbi:MAG: hypothetical protein HC809_16865, partial [Gammaproteobacteria bacterium]|nr:hypothetical protein [Gammaproteobacteria bacterium]
SADYITVNISSPNTPGLRDLQEAGALAASVAALAHPTRRPRSRLGSTRTVARQTGARSG